MRIHSRHRLGPFRLHRLHRWQHPFVCPCLRHSQMLPRTSLRSLHRQRPVRLPLPLRRQVAVSAPPKRRKSSFGACTRLEMLARALLLPARRQQHRLLRPSSCRQLLVCRRSVEAVRFHPSCHRVPRGRLCPSTKLRRHRLRRWQQPGCHRHQSKPTSEIINPRRTLSLLRCFLRACR